MWRVVLATVCLLLTLSGCAAAPGKGIDCPPSRASTVAETLVSGERERRYLVSTPEGPAPEAGWPLVLAFHGRAESAEQIQRYSGLSALPAVVVYPQGTVHEGMTDWQGAPYSTPGVDDVAFVGQLLDHLEPRYCVDPHRIGATGKSNGGGFTALLACRMPDRIAAFAPVAGAFYPQTVVPGCATPAPLIVFHGTADAVIPYQGGTAHGTPLPALPEWLAGWARRNGCDPEPRTGVVAPGVTEQIWAGCALHHFRIDGGGHTWPGGSAPSGPGAVTGAISATQLIWAFFSDHPRG